MSATTIPTDEVLSNFFNKKRIFFIFLIKRERYNISYIRMSKKLPIIEKKYSFFIINLRNGVLLGKDSR